MRDASEIERAVAAFAREPNGGLIVTASAFGAGSSRTDHLACGPSQAACGLLRPLLRHRSGGLISYGTDNIDEYRRAAGYVDRILKGEKPADLPVQAADQVRAGDQSEDRQGLGLTVPPTLLARADEVIE